jgi:hypothetical protein
LAVGHYFGELPKLFLTEMSARPADPARNVSTDVLSPLIVGFVIPEGESFALSLQNTVRQQEPVWPGRIEATWVFFARLKLVVPQHRTDATRWTC